MKYKYELSKSAPKSVMSLECKNDLTGCHVERRAANSAGTELLTIISRLEARGHIKFDCWLYDGALLLTKQILELEKAEPAEETEPFSWSKAVALFESSHDPLTMNGMIEVLIDKPNRTATHKETEHQKRLIDFGYSRYDILFTYLMRTHYA